MRLSFLLRLALVLAALLALAATVQAWTAVEHDAASTPRTPPRYEGRDTVPPNSIPLPNVYIPSNGGTWTNLGACDDCVQVINVPTFRFPWYGIIRTNFEVASNGFITMGTSNHSGCCSGEQNPTPGGAGDDLVAPYWNDINPGAGGQWDWKVINPQSNTSREVLIVRWDNVPHFGGLCCISTQTHFFEETGVVEVHYNTVTGDGFETGGMEDSAGSWGINYFAFNGGMGTQAVQYRPYLLGPIARDDSYTTTFAPSGILNVNGITPLVNVTVNDSRLGNVPMTADTASATTPRVVATGTPWGTVMNLNADGTFRFQMPGACPPGMNNFDVRFQYRAQDAWRPGNLANVTIRITNCNTAPVANDDTLTTQESATPQTLAVLANDFDADVNDTIAIDAIVTFAGPGTLVVAGAGATLSYTPPHADFNSAIHGGPLTAVYRIRDTRGGTDTATVTWTINAVNDAPRFTPASALITLAEGAGPYSAAWATSLAPGPATATDEAAQTLAFDILSNTNPGLFDAANLPAISPAGTLTFALRDADVNRDVAGDAILSVVLRDSGPSGSPHANSAAPVELRITVDPVNDAPSFTPGAAQVTVAEGPGARTVPWATNLARGPPGATDEATQSLSFSVTNTLPSLFAPTGQPTVDASGNLRFTLVDVDANRLTHGEADLTIWIFDSGPSAPPDSNVGTSAAVKILVDPVNDPPSFVAGSDVTFLEGDLPLARSIPWATALAPGGGSDETSQLLAFRTTTNLISGSSTLFSAPPSIAPDGTLQFTVANVDAYGVAHVTVQLYDDGNDVPPNEADSATHLLRITISGVNDPPVAVDDTLAALLPDVPGQVLPDVILNDLDPDHPNGLLRIAQLDTAGFPGTVALGSNGRTLTITPNAGATGTASLRYQLTDGQLPSGWATVTMPIEAPLTPLVTIRGDTRACVGVEYPMLGIASWRGHTPIRYLWTLGGATTDRATVGAIDPLPQTFQTRATVPVTLEVTFRRNSDLVTVLPPTSHVRQVVVAGCSIPTVAFAVHTVGLQVQFTDASSDPEGLVSWLWEFGNGATSVERSPTHTYARSHDWRVRLTVTDGDGDMGTYEVVVPVHAGSGTSVAQVVPAAPGAPPPAGAADEPRAPPLTAAPTNRPPIAVVAPAGPMAVGSVLRLDATPSHDPDGDAMTYRWRQIAGPTVIVTDSTTPTPTLTVPAGSATFEVTVRDAHGSDKATVVVTGTQAYAPRPGFVAMRTAQEPAHVTFDDVTQAGASATYAWDFGDGATSSAREPTHNYAAPGTYIVRLAVTENGQTAETFQTLIVPQAQALPPQEEREPLDQIRRPATGGFSTTALAIMGVVAGVLVIAAVGVVVAVARRP